MGEIAKRIEYEINEMSAFSEPDSIGTTRLPFTKEAKEAEGYLKGLMEKAGLSVRTDESGAVIGRLEGRRKETYMIGSHYDTVENGGNYDGIAGVLCGIEIARMLAGEGQPEYSLEIIATNDEEGARFSGGFFSSKAMLGEWTVEELKRQKDKNGISIYDAMLEYGLEPEQLHKAKRSISEIKGFFEIHIEQGPVLQAAGADIGVVKTIVGMQRLLVTVHGRADHAGTTPMDMRKDALEMAAKVIGMTGDCARKYPDTVATVGYVKVSPNVVNTIADKVEFSLDIRSPLWKNVENVLFEINRILSGYTACDRQCTLTVKPADMNENFRKMISGAAGQRGFSWQEINSGAGHDSLPIGKVIPTAMLFVPSMGGRSHCKEEYTNPESFEKAVLVLYDVVKVLLNER